MVSPLGTDAASDDVETCTLKVNVTEDQKLRLHTMKILTGRNVSSAVREALDRFFEEMAEDPEGKELLDRTDEILS